MAKWQQDHSFHCHIHSCKGAAACWAIVKIIDKPFIPACRIAFWSDKPLPSRPLTFLTARFALSNGS